MTWISRFYILFIGIILCVTTGFGIAAFYSEPIRPAYPSMPTAPYPVPINCNATVQSQKSGECQGSFQKQEQSNLQAQAAQDKYAEDTKIFDNKNAGYTRTAIFFGIAIGSLFAVIGLGLIKKSKLVAKGLL